MDTLSLQHANHQRVPEKRAGRQQKGVPYHLVCTTNRYPPWRIDIDTFIFLERKSDQCNYSWAFPAFFAFRPDRIGGRARLAACPVSLKPPRIPLKHFPHLPRSKMTGQRCPTPREIMRQENMTSIRVQNIPQPSKMAPIVPRLGCSSRRRIYVAVYFVFGGVNGNTLGPKDIGTLVFSWPTASTGG